MSKNVGQSFGACFLVHPNTGHCFFPWGDPITGGAWPLPAVGEPSSAFQAALAALLAALFFFFPPWVVAAALAGGAAHESCVTDVPDNDWAVTPSSSGDAGRTLPIAGGNPPGLVGSEVRLSLSSSDSTLRLAR
jgi:hypothetical protein